MVNLLLLLSSSPSSFIIVVVIKPITRTPNTSEKKKLHELFHLGPKMAEITAGRHWSFTNRSGSVTMVTPLLFNPNMILLSLHSVPKHLTPVPMLISVEKAATCCAHKRCFIQSGARKTGPPSRRRTWL